MANEHEATQAGSVRTFKGEDRKNYGGNYQVNGKVLGCYTKKQMKSLYPGKDYERVGEYAPNSKKSTIGTFEYKDAQLRLAKFRSHNRVIYREKGCVSVGEDRFISLLKNAILTRALGVVLCIALIVTGVVFAVNADRAAETATLSDEMIAAGSTANENPLEFEEGAVDWEGVQPRETGGITAGIAIPGYKSITIDANQKDVKVNLLNPENNPCYFVISIILDDGTVLYQSKMIEPGKGLYDITLTEPLDRGEYSARVKYETYSLNDQSSLNGAEVAIILIAQ